ncbi:uncharacterized protein LOC126900069 [Daktulosphaira vitifoliae]|uniref:uncharacterized protein LOC126900069 n=1 Tax=Daktulosphaira vitifoliae TaxID=58002 RepID=UPI0021A9C014|nr:uncharacterized protein LOC126900069 [Daktulosphaira vitifoliae]
MFIKIYYFTFFIFWINQIDTTSYRLVDESDYVEYLLEVIKYVLFPGEDSSMQHLTDGLTLNSDSIPNFLGNLSLHLNVNNLPRIYDAINELLICRYTIVIEIFIKNIGLILQYCDNYHLKNQFHDLTECLITLNDALESSKTLFENINNVIQFFSNLHMNYVFNKYEKKINIIDEISFINDGIQSNRKLDILEYIDNNGNPKVEMVIEDIENVKNFHNIISSIISFTSITNNKYYSFQDELKNDDAMKHDNYSISCLDYVQVCNNLKVFYDEAFKLEYINFGFHNLLHPTTPGLVSPLYDDSSEDLAVKVINTIINVDNSQLLINTKILVNDQIKDLNEILYDAENLNNFFKKKQEVAHIFRCRYSELLRYVTDFLGAIQHVCISEQKNEHYDNLITCVNSLKSTFPAVTTMINGLLEILALFKKASIGDYMMKSQSCFKIVVKIASEYNNILKSLNISLNAETNATNVIEFLDTIRQKRLIVTRLLSHNKFNKFFNYYCVPEKKLLTLYELTRSYENIYHNLIFLNLSSDLIQICEDFVKTDYDLYFSELIYYFL